MVGDATLDTPAVTIDLDVSGCARRPGVGEVVHIIPNHACVVSNLHDTVTILRAGRVEGEWAVAARGQTR